MHRRRPWLAAILALPFPGLGHVYVGHLRKAVLWALLPHAFFISGLLLGVALPAMSTLILWTRLVPYLALWLFQAVSAASEAGAAPAYELRSVNRVWVYVCFALFFFGAKGAVETVVRAFVLEPYQMPSVSMAPTLEQGDQFYAFKMGPGARIEHGAVIAWSNRHYGKVFVNRVVGLPGDTVTIANGRLSVSGRSISAKPCVPAVFSYIAETSGNLREESGQCELERDGDREHRVLHIDRANPRWDGSWTVPQGTVFVLGDSRENANDSRVEGPVPAEDIIGRAWSIWMAFRPGSLIPRFERVGSRL